MITIDDILHDLRPGAEYGRRGEPVNEAEYDSMIIWRDPVTVKPTYADLVTQKPITRLRVAKEKKVAELQIEMANRQNVNMGTNLPIEYLNDMLNWLDTLWRSVDAGSRNPRIAWTNAINIQQAFIDARNVINNFAVLNDVNNYDVVNDPAWPVV